MARNFPDWIRGFMDYASYGEAPRYMHFWTAVSVIAGALRRKVWLDEIYFRWYPNFYIIFVAPPGIVSKSTTASIGHNLLKQVEGVQYGPDIVTWQSLVTSFANASESFEVNGESHTMAALTLVASEFGNLLDPSDKNMVDLFVKLWDGEDIKKETKHSGHDYVVNPWINLIACTTPSWVAGNFPEYMIGGGLSSRCLYVYASEKFQFIPYPSQVALPDMKGFAAKLVEDLSHIATNLAGAYKLTPEAVRWGSEWYIKHYTEKNPELTDERYGGYIARKQSHIHKLAMILAAATSDELIITENHLMLAFQMVTDLEQDMLKVFEKIGKTDKALYTERLLQYVKAYGVVSYQESYKYVHSQFPSLKDYEDILAGCVRAGYLKLITTEKGVMIKFQADMIKEG